MNSSIGQNSLDELLDAYCEASEEPNREILAEWIARYPQFERELIDFTVAWIQSEELPELADNQQDKEAGLQAGLRIAQQIYEKMGTDGLVQKSPSRPKLVSLILDGSLRGWPTDDFAQRINLSVAILRKLESRLITVATIPGNLIERISASLQRDRSEVIAYLEQEPVIQRDLRYKSKQSPRLGRQQNFFDAVRNDGELSDEQRTYWLSFEGRTR
jgi:hypothetical protein